MFRMLIMTKPATASQPAGYQYLTEGRDIWETESKDAALERFELELENYKKSLLTLIKVNEVDLNPTIEDDPTPTPTVEYVLTADTNYLEGKEYFRKDGDNYILLVAGTDYEVGAEITGEVYEKKTI